MLMMNEVRAELFLRRLPPQIRASLTREQEAALRDAAAGRAVHSHPIDLRFTVPTPWGRYYIALLGGPERRSRARLASERRIRPLATTGNVLFAGGVLVALSLLVLVGLLLAGAVFGA